MLFLHLFRTSWVAIDAVVLEAMYNICIKISALTKMNAMMLPVALIPVRTLLEAMNVVVQTVINLIKVYRIV